VREYVARESRVMSGTRPIPSTHTNSRHPRMPAGQRPGAAPAVSPACSLPCVPRARSSAFRMPAPPHAPLRSHARAASCHRSSSVMRHAPPSLLVCPPSCCHACFPNQHGLPRRLAHHQSTRPCCTLVDPHGTLAQDPLRMRSATDTRRSARVRHRHSRGKCPLTQEERQQSADAPTER